MLTTGDIARLAGFLRSALLASLLAAGFVHAEPAATGARAAAQPATAVAARLGGDDKRTRFVVDLNRAVGFSVFVVPKPFRVIIDLPEVNFQLPPGLGETGRGLVSAFRYGLFSPGKSRIVLDASAPVLIEKSFVLGAKNGQPARLVVDLMRTDAVTFARMRSRQEALSATKKDGAKSSKAAKRKTSRPVRTARRDKPKSPRLRSRRPTIVIDPGHGGVDPGAISRRGTAEKSVVLSFSKTLYQKLAATKRYRVYLTRSDDKFLRLRKRVAIARARGADLFIAVHADSIRRGSATGATIYTLSERASDKEAEALAAKENRADIIAGVDLDDENSAVASILIDLAQRETNNHSAKFANLTVKYLRGSTRLTRRPHRFAGFRVLKAPDTPSILLELGYLSSRRDEKRLLSKTWQKKVAASIIRAMDAFFRARIADGTMR